MIDGDTSYETRGTNITRSKKANLRMLVAV